MAQRKTLEVFIVVDSNGDYVAGETYETATDAFSENIGGSEPRRILKLSVTVTLPEEIEETSIDVPDTAGTTLNPVEAVAE